MRKWSTWLLRSIALSLLLGLASPAWAAKIPSENEQEILIRTTLMTFNDANMTGNYSVLFAKASPEFQSQLSAGQLATAFKTYREKEVNIESIVADDIASSDDATIDKEGVLHLVGAFKDDEKRVKFNLKFLQHKGAWKLLGINVQYGE